MSISVAFFCLFGFIFVVTQYFQFVKGYSSLSAGVHTLPFAVVAAVFTPIGAVLALRVGTAPGGGGRVGADGGRPGAGGADLDSPGRLLRPGDHGHDPAGPRPLAHHRAGHRGRHGLPRPRAGGRGRSGEQHDAELGGTLGVAMLGSVFVSAYGPRILHALAGYPVPAPAEGAARQSVAAALVVVAHAPVAVRPTVRAAVFSAFGSGLEAACMVGAGVAVIGALVAFALLPGRAPRTRRRMPARPAQEAATVVSVGTPSR